MPRWVGHREQRMGGGGRPLRAASLRRSRGRAGAGPRPGASRSRSSPPPSAMLFGRSLKTGQLTCYRREPVLFRVWPINRLQGRRRPRGALGEDGELDDHDDRYQEHPHGNVERYPRAAMTERPPDPDRGKPVDHREAEHDEVVGQGRTPAPVGQPAPLWTGSFGQPMCSFARKPTCSKRAFRCQAGAISHLSLQDRSAGGSCAQ